MGLVGVGKTEYTIAGQAIPEQGAIPGLEDVKQLGRSRE
jgi:hypothetical protein